LNFSSSFLKFLLGRHQQLHCANELVSGEPLPVLHSASGLEQFPQTTASLLRPLANSSELTSEVVRDNMMGSQVERLFVAIIMRSGLAVRKTATTRRSYFT